MVRLFKRNKLLLFTILSPVFLLIYAITTNSFVTYKLHRSECCVIPTVPRLVLKDICGRKHCNFPCLDPLSFIPELDNGQAPLAKDERAFLIETMGNNKLDTRQACAVESLALFNPTLKIYVLFTGGQVNYTDITLHALIEKYDNLNFVGVNLEDYVTGTPVENWYQCTNWRKGQYHVSHLSDALRFLTLAKYGGYYFDLDVIHIRSVLDYRNFTATENGKGVSVGALHASYGHPLMRMAVEDFAKNYKMKVWAHNGPDLLTRVLKKWCGVKEYKSMNPENCQGFHILPQSSFYPVPYNQWKEYFAESNQTSKNVTPSWLTEEVIAVHVWNKKSAQEPIQKNSTQFYVQLARKSCPVTFSAAPDKF